MDRRDFLSVSVSAAAGLLCSGLFSKCALAGAAPRATSTPALPSLSINDATLHFLNRISWGVLPEDYQHAQTVGIPAYLEEQLNPDAIKDTGADRYVKKLSLLFADRAKTMKMKGSGDHADAALKLGMLNRAIYSKRQLLERMVEFWSDHFNITSTDLEVDSLQFQRQAIRKYALGKFSDLLAATAHEPAMLYYLNNAENVAEHPNENYAREIMELHTIGVTGGYVEADVKNIARAFTGWTVDDSQPGGFAFNPDVHDGDAKMVLGNPLPAGRGIEDGQDVLNILATHPSTAKNICRKLVVRFVSDAPPQTLIDAMVATWNQNGGEIKPVLRTLFLSAEFSAAVRVKLRRPLDFFIAALRLTGTPVKNLNDAEYLLENLSQVPYGWHAPNGYPDVAAAWNNTSGVLTRWNTALSLMLDSFGTKGHNPVLKTFAHVQTVGELVDLATQRVFLTTFPDNLRDTLVAYIGGGTASAPVTKDILKYKVGPLFGLLLSSDLFQWR